MRISDWSSDVCSSDLGSAEGEPHGPSHSLGGSFATGVLATLLATPCSAPFLGTSVGFALSRGAIEIFLIFTALGLGLALPYLLVAAVPRPVAWLPRPGPWVELGSATGRESVGTDG